MNLRWEGLPGLRGRVRFLRKPDRTPHRCRATADRHHATGSCGALLRGVACCHRSGDRRGAGVIGWAVGRSSAEEAAAVTVTAGGETAEEEPAGTAAMGREVYLNAGCSACHGLNAEGTDVGPSVAGHTAQQVHQQVRSPLAQMPAYSEAQLSEEDLDQVAGYLAALESMEEHAEPVKLSDVLAIHHWMAISAITAGDPNDALHHVGHIIERVKGEHLETMEKARALLRQGDLHEAEHLIEEMLAGKAKPELTLAELNLRLALTAVDERRRPIRSGTTGRGCAEPSERRVKRSSLTSARATCTGPSTASPTSSGSRGTDPGWG